MFSKLPPAELERGLARLRDDLDSGRWHGRNAALLERDELDLGYRLVVAELGGRGRRLSPRPRG